MDIFTNDKWLINMPKEILIHLANEINNKRTKEKEDGCFKGYTYEEAKIISYAKLLK